MAGVGFGRALRSFLTSVVALARLASVFSRLVSHIWSELNSLAGVLAEWGLFGRRVWARGSFMKRLMRWALARMDSFGWTSLAGCMALR